MNNKSLLVCGVITLSMAIILFGFACGHYFYNGEISMSILCLILFGAFSFAIGVVVNELISYTRAEKVAKKMAKEMAEFLWSIKKESEPFKEFDNKNERKEK